MSDDIGIGNSEDGIVIASGAPRPPPPPPPPPPSSSSSLSHKDEQLWRWLRDFVVRHASRHAPVALVTSGGRTAPLEVETVRFFLDNFSTGMRGAVAVEEFVRRGYAVVHLRRMGSACPHGRVLGRELGWGSQRPPTFESLGRLFDVSSGNLGDRSEEEEEEGEGGDDKDKEENGGGASGGDGAPRDPWMYLPGIRNGASSVRAAGSSGRWRMGGSPDCVRE